MNYYEHVEHKNPKIPIIFHPHETTQNQNAFNIHFHEHMEAILMTEGKADFLLNNVPITLKKGEMLVIPSNAFHEMTYKKSTATYHCLIIQKEFLSSLFFTSDIQLRQNVFTDTILTFEYEKIIACLNDKQAYYEASATGHCILFLSHLFREYAYKIPLDKGEKCAKIDIVKKAMESVINGYTEEFSLDKLAKQVQCSKYYLCRIFKETTGQTIVHYLNTVRVHQAKKLITLNHYSVKEAAFASGFSNLSYMTRKYKELMGVLPSEEKHIE